MFPKCTKNVYIMQQLNKIMKKTTNILRDLKLVFKSFSNGKLWNSRIACKNIFNFLLGFFFFFLLLTLDFYFLGEKRKVLVFLRPKTSLKKILLFLSSLTFP